MIDASLPAVRLQAVRLDRGGRAILSGSADLPAELEAAAGPLRSLLAQV